jgi:hypothetical protein
MSTWRSTSRARTSDLAEYSPALLDQMIAVVTASTVTAYALYTMSPETPWRSSHAPAPGDPSVRALRNLPVLYLLYQRRLGATVGAAARRPRAAHQHGLLDLRGFC